MENLKAGDEVRVFGRPSHRFDPTPEGGWRGTVTKVARRYATAEFEVLSPDGLGGERTMTHTIEFDMETGRERGAQTSHCRTVRDPEKVERNLRRAAAMAILKEAGLERSSRREPSLELAEALAAVVETFGQEG